MLFFVLATAEVVVGGFPWNHCSQWAVPEDVAHKEIGGASDHTSANFMTLTFIGTMTLY